MIVTLVLDSKSENGAVLREKFFDYYTSYNKANVKKFSKAAISSEVGICSTIGKEILLAGGNAVDAAIATLLCIGVINNFSSGIGG